MFDSSYDDRTTELLLRRQVKIMWAGMKIRGEPVPYNPMKADDQLFLIGSESASPYIRPKIIYPPQSTALPAPL